MLSAYRLMWVTVRFDLPVVEKADQKAATLFRKTLLDMEQGDYSSAATRQQSKALMRYILNHYLDDQPLHTRQLLRDLQQL